MTCLAEADWVALADSMLRAGAHPDDLLMDLRQVSPDQRYRVTKLMSRTSRLSESGTESLLRHDLTSAGVKVRTQVWIGSDRVDLLLGDHLVVEADSVAHHTGLETYARDRRRDQRLIAQGFIVVRLTWHQIIHERADTIAYLVGLCRQGVHRSGRLRRLGASR